VIVVDTSIWVDHFRRRDPELMALIGSGEVVLHPYVLGELLLGGFPTKGEAAEQMQILLNPPVASASEAAAFIAWAKLAGTGVGYVDAHLLISAKLMSTGRVLTRDKRLQRQAKRLGLAFDQ
jgi:hypothetical protein